MIRLQQLMNLLNVFDRRQVYYLFLCVIIYVFTIALVALKYKMLLNYMQEKLSILESFQVILFSLFAGYISPFKTGMVVAKPLITKYFSKTPLKKSFFVITVEQFADLGWQLIFLFFCMLLQQQTKLFKGLIVRYIIAALFFFFAYYLLKKRSLIILLIWRFIKILPGKVRRKINKLNLDNEEAKVLLDKYLSYLSNKTLFFKYFLLTLIHAMIVPIILVLAGIIFNAQIIYGSAFLAFWASFLIGRLSGLPGGIGLRDVSLGGFLVLYGIDTTTMLKIVLLFRVLTTMPVFIFGIPLFLYHVPRMKLKKLI